LILHIWKYIKKSKLSMLLIMMLFCVTFGFSIFFTKLGMTGFSLLHALSRYNFYICFFIVILSFYIISSAGRYSYKEVSESIAGKAVYEKSAFLYILSILMIWNTGICIILIECSRINDGTAYFISWFWLNYVCNIVIPQLICVTMTYVISYSENSSRWITIELGFLFLISPLAGYVCIMV
jgi:hypothetical protein